MAKVIVPSLPTRYDAATQQQVPTVDLNPASHFGELVIMSEHPAYADDIDAAAVRTIKITESDYIMAVGDVALIGVAVAHAIEQTGRARILRWSKVRHHYDVWEVE